ncbi:hypothetical protein [uncultured archaeal virus]|uniref:Uncharacterized protein n=1 Tax=uncultured archaeal virus TaxID=1960247 RepID=A0A8B0LSZ9_9VIRU|nr:hypothetical protein [uncultured archaeal virus]
MALELTKGDTLKIKIGVKNESDGFTGTYKISVVIMDSKNTKYYFSYHTDGSTFSTTQQSITETLTKGTEYSLSYSAVIPDYEDGTVTANIGIYGEEGITEIIGTGWFDAYTYSKKKMNLSSLSVTLEKG